MTPSISTVVSNGACTGCGNCAFATGYPMKLNAYGEYVPDFPEEALNQGSNKMLASVCPSLNYEKNETVIADELFPNTSLDLRFGRYIDLWAGHVTEKTIRNNSTSGGLATWLARELFVGGKITGVIHAHKSQRDYPHSPFFHYGVSCTEDEILSAAGTRYHVLEMSEVLGFVRENEGKYLFIGVPCFVKALRLLQHDFPILTERIIFAASLVCGHYKSVNWSILLGWSSGISPAAIESINYRVKGQDIPPRSYIVRAKSQDGAVTQINTNSVIGGKFNSGAMMLPACALCDDVVGETADVSFGDAWLPEFESDHQGTNLVIVRSERMAAIFRSAKVDAKIRLQRLEPDDVHKAQAGAFRQRGEGLAYRLAVRAQRSQWVPTKRVKPNMKDLSLIRRKIYQTREVISDKSRESFILSMKEGSLEGFFSSLRYSVAVLRWLELASGLPRAVHRRVLTLFYRIGKR